MSAAERPTVRDSATVVNTSADIARGLLVTDAIPALEKAKWRLENLAAFAHRDHERPSAWRQEALREALTETEWALRDCWAALDRITGEGQP